MTYDTMEDGESKPLLQEGGYSEDGTSNVTKKEGPRYSKRCRTLLGIIAAVATTTAVAMTVLVHSSSSTGVHPIASAFSSVFGTRRTQGESCNSPWLFRLG